MKESSLIKMQKDLEILERFCVMLLGKIENLEKKVVVGENRTPTK